MVLSGLIIGAVSFLIIGIFHPIVVYGEYYFTERIWPVFLVGGLFFCVWSLFVQAVVLSATLAVIGFTMLWSIKELKEQTDRVRKGWFPANPKRSNK